MGAEDRHFAAASTRDVSDPASGVGSEVDSAGEIDGMGQAGLPSKNARAPCLCPHRCLGADVRLQTAWARLQLLNAGSWFSPTLAGERLPLCGELLDVTHRMRPKVILFLCYPAAVAEAVGNVGS
jgi:hypothetical protein